MAEDNGHLTILGAGAAGLSTGYYAAMHGRPFTIFEKSGRTGGMCATIRHGDFSFDCGAHRFHDRVPEVTAEVKTLLGDRLRRIRVPSHIYHNGALVNFPFTPFNMTKRIGALTAARAAMEVLAARSRTGAGEDLETYAAATYGKTLARMFLLNYSEKLWGAECGRLSAELAGDRLKGMTPRALILELLNGHKNGSAHLDGSFYYPEGGIGVITQELTAACGADNIKTGAAVTSIKHDTRAVTSITINDREHFDAQKLISSLPCTVMVRLMNPAPPARVLQSAARLRFRNIILVALFLDTERATNSATIYFPSRSFSFTRVYEPKNRCASMSPPGQTSLVAEIPCHESGGAWDMPDNQIADMVAGQLADCGIIRAAGVFDTAVIRVPHAYPVIERDSKEHAAAVLDYLSGFANLKMIGRAGTFRYLWLHDMITAGKEAALF